MPEKFTDRKTPKVMFANCGHGSHRRLEDSAKFNFLSAGQGKFEKQDPFYFSNQIRNLIIGDILAVYRNKIGFVGVARVISEPMTISKAYLDGQKVSNAMFSRLSNMFNNSDDPGFAECLVEIKWLTKVHLSEKLGSGFCYGGDTPRNVTCELSLEKYQCLEKEKSLGVSFSTLLKDIKNSIIIDEDEELTFPEGKEIFRLHKSKERNKELVKKAKDFYFQKDSKLSCQVCGFSFVDNYGEIGKGFIEAHHLFPISQLEEATETKIEDLAFVCSNCHRMLHRQRPWLNLEALKALKAP
jgi:hypothetical protein